MKVKKFGELNENEVSVSNIDHEVSVANIDHFIRDILRHTTHNKSEGKTTIVEIVDAKPSGDTAIITWKIK